MDDTVAHDDAEAERAAIVLFQRGVTEMTGRVTVWWPRMGPPQVWD